MYRRDYHLIRSLEMMLSCISLGHSSRGVREFCLLSAWKQLCVPLLYIVVRARISRHFVTSCLLHA